MPPISSKAFLAVVLFSGGVIGCGEGAPADVEDSVGSLERDIVGGVPEGGYRATGYLKRKGSSSMGCAATLIDAKAVVTAAHCVESPGQLQFGLGAYGSGPLYEVTKVIVHPGHRPNGSAPTGGLPTGDSTRFNGARFRHDVAVLLLDDGPNIPAAQISEPRFLPSVAIGYGRTTVGPQGQWGGYTRERRSATYRLEGDDGFNLFGFGVDSSICWGDSGGPLMLAKTNQIIGVLADWNSSNPTCKPGMGAIFTSLDGERAFLDGALPNGLRPTAAAVCPSGSFVPAWEQPDFMPFAVSASTPDNAWIVGGGTFAMSWNGASWQRVSVGARKALMAVWAWDRKNAWAVDMNHVYRFDGVSWAETFSPPGGENMYFNAVWGTGPKEVWASSYFGGVAKWNGTSWSWLANADQPSPRLTGIWASGPDDLWGVSSDAVYRRQGSKWVASTPGSAEGVDSYMTLWGSGPDDVWVGGLIGEDLEGNRMRMLHWDGFNWSVVKTPLENRLTAITGTGERDVWATDWLGNVAHYCSSNGWVAWTPVAGKAHMDSFVLPLGTKTLLIGSDRDGKGYGYELK